MDKTLFELVPVSVKPDVAGEYSVCYSDDGIADTSSLWEPERGWYNDRYTDTPITHYLRPLAPPVAEERTFTLAEAMEIYISAYANGTWDEGHPRDRDKIEMKEYFKTQFNITLPE